ncbi:unnamed protein product [Staurois parvus]|uniref:Uncharacterized protein n=1 Tax=Staurois parvus TaxID=386267 RepID=A0ABN9AZB5_9NEOB|nr:unnamed protein product [Staurois parvus]
MPHVSAHQCHINVTYQCLPVHINSTYQCPSELPFSASQPVPPISAHLCHLSVLPISVTYHQCCLTVSVSAAYQCHISADFQCPSVMPVNAHQCHLPVPPHQCSLSMQPISAHHCSSLAHISEGEKLIIYNIL